MTDKTVTVSDEHECDGTGGEGYFDRDAQINFLTRVDKVTQTYYKLYLDYRTKEKFRRDLMAVIDSVLN